MFTYHIPDIERTEVLKRDCGFNDVLCVARTRDAYMKNRTCWYDRDNLHVRFSYPNETRMKGAIAGLCIGAVFVFLSFLMCACIGCSLYTSPAFISVE